jgi:serine/threonine protein kinase
LRGGLALNEVIKRDFYTSEARIDDAITKNVSLFTHEQIAIDSISKSINEYKLGKDVSNVILFDRQSNSFLEYDLIVVISTGIFVVELKHWSGHIKINSKSDPYNWVINGVRYRRNPHILNGFKCKVFKGIYQHEFRTLPNIRVESIVVLTHPDATVEGASSPTLCVEQDMPNPTFSSIKDFILYLRKHTVNKRKIIDHNQVNSIIDYLCRINKPKVNINYTIPGFETIEYINQSATVIELIVRPLAGNSRRLNRFRVFRLSQQGSTLEIERFKKIAVNTFNAVSLINEHPNIGKVWLVPNEEGDIIEGSDWSEVGTLRDVINECKEDNRFPVEKTNQILQGIINGLSVAHEHNVIHRALRPENVLLINGIPKLINFDLSYQYDQSEFEHLTVIPEPWKIKDDGYIAPEVLLGNDIDERTDYFSFGVVTYELFTGKKPFENVKEFQAKGGLLTPEQIQQLRNLGIQERIIHILRKLIVVDRNSRINSVKDILAAFNIDSDQDSYITNQSLNAKLEPGTQYDIYEIVQLIGEGVEAQIYKAHTLQVKSVAVKIYNQEVPFERINQEAKVLETIKSSYVVRYDKIGYWNKDRYYISMDYIDGETLRTFIERGERPDWKFFQKVTQCMLEAIKAFHLHQDDDGNVQPFLHSDLKPDNILVTKDRKAVLIDCGIAGEPRVGVFQGTIGYVPPDYIVGSEMEYAQDGDLFALGVTLWEWLFGVKPYKNPTIYDQPSFAQPLNTDYPSHIQEWLTRAVATNKNQRFNSIQEMEESFFARNGALEKINDETVDVGEKDRREQGNGPLTTDTPICSGDLDKNDFVDYLNSLTNASAGNENAIAEAQIGNKYFERIFVNNPLTDFVYNELSKNRKSVILTGNAGDGKTTIAAEIYRRIAGPGPLKIMGPRIDEGRLVIIKDMSELPKDEQIGILEEAILDDNKIYLIVANTGVLLESGSKVKVAGIDPNLTRAQLLNAIASDNSESVFNDQFILINIARTDSISTACEVFKKVTSMDWIICTKCKQKKCPVYLNIQLINESQDTVLERIELLYRRLYEYGIRLTMRQMIGHLAYSLTSGKSCQEIMEYPRLALEKKLPGMLFINRFFGDDGETVQQEALQLDPVRQIRNYHFGSELEPSFERDTWVMKESALPISGQVAKAVQGELFDRLEFLGTNGRMQIRRLAYFFGFSSDFNCSQFILRFLRSPMLEDYLTICRDGKQFLPAIEYSYRTKILQVLQEYFIGVRLTDGVWDKILYITLNRQGLSGRTQMVIADFREDDFKLCLKSEGRLARTNAIYLECKNKAMMKLDLPFLDYVLHRQQGEVAEELSGYYSDRIERFKLDLSSLYAKEGYCRKHILRLLRILPSRKFEILNLEINNGNLEVLG